MEYLLITTQARHKTGEDISNDTLLFAYKDQFRKFPDHKAAWFYFYIGKIYSLQGNANQALCEYMECEKLLTDDVYLTAMLQAAYAEAYMDKLELDESISFFQQAAENFQEIQHWPNVSTCYSQIGICFLANNKLDSAFFYYDKCFKYQQYWQPSQKAAMLINLVQAYSISGQNHIAAEHLEQALQLPLNNNEKAIVYGHLAKLHISEPDKFLDYIQRGISILPEEETDPLLLSRFYNELSQFYADNNETELALEYHLLYSNYLVLAIRTGYDTTIKELRQENHIRHLYSENLQLTVTRQRSQQFFLTVCFVAITIIFIISRQFKRKKQKLMEAEQKIETLQDMVSQDTQEKNSLRNIVLQHFNLIKKVAQLQAISSTKNY
ncbi:MAG: tetratricopeptide repeat protein, partial [Bacteroides sp.]|nr:tetratricopeptide repeat protein [Bacteroides sp.]